MPPHFRFFLNILALVVVVVSISLFLRFRQQPQAITLTLWQAPAASSSAAATVNAVGSQSTSNLVQTTTTTTTTIKPQTSPILSAKKIVKPPTKTIAAPPIQTASASSTPIIARIPNPYSEAPLSSDQVNMETRGALVNILCLSNGSIRSISGSGVIIDPRGVILTNAHVGQYVMLSENPNFNLDCTIRTGSPAHPLWRAQVLYIPQAWINAHYSELNMPSPAGNGEHDYALLLITGTTNGAAVPDSFPYLPVDTRQAIGFTSDEVLAASYPAEFLGGTITENDLYAVSSDVTIKQLLTFGGGTVDLLSLGGIIEAQAGSSGGAVVNPWGRLIGLIVTTSEGATTAERDLHALTLYYIDRDMAAQTGAGLSSFFNGDLNAKLNDFNANSLKPLLQKYFNLLQSRQQ